MQTISWQKLGQIYQKSYNLLFLELTASPAPGKYLLQNLF